MTATSPLKISQASFPTASGVYLVYDQQSATVPLYIGKAVTQTIRDRWLKQHLKPRAGGSALRRSLGVYLALTKEKLKRPSRYYEKEVESKISIYLNDCFIEIIEVTAEQASELEERLICDKMPRLNVCHNKGSVQ